MEKFLNEKEMIKHCTLTEDLDNAIKKGLEEDYYDIRSIRSLRIDEDVFEEDFEDEIMDS